MRQIKVKVSASSCHRRGVINQDRGGKDSFCVGRTRIVESSEKKGEKEAVYLAKLPKKCGNQDCTYNEIKLAD